MKHIIKQYSAQVADSGHVRSSWTPLPVQPSYEDRDILLPHYHTPSSEPIYEITIGGSDLERLDNDLQELRKLQQFMREHPTAQYDYDKWVCWQQLKW